MPLLTLLFAYGTVVSVFRGAIILPDGWYHEAKPVAGLSASALLTQRAGKPVVAIAAAGGGFRRLPGLRTWSRDLKR